MGRESAAALGHRIAGTVTGSQRGRSVIPSDPVAIRERFQQIVARTQTAVLLSTGPAPKTGGWRTTLTLGRRRRPVMDQDTDEVPEVEVVAPEIDHYLIRLPADEEE